MLRIRHRVSPARNKWKQFNDVRRHHLWSMVRGWKKSISYTMGDELTIIHYTVTHSCSSNKSINEPIAGSSFFLFPSLKIIPRSKKKKRGARTCEICIHRSIWSKSMRSHDRQPIRIGQSVALKCVLEIVAMRKKSYFRHRLADAERKE